MNKTLLLTSASVFALILAASVPAHAVDGARAEAISASSGNTATDNGSLRDNLLQNAFNPVAGIVHSQQNNGDNNAMGSALTVVANGITFGFNN